MIQRLKEVVFGRPKNPLDPQVFHHLSLIAFFAWIGLGADGLSSSCYGPEEAFLALGHDQYLLGRVRSRLAGGVKQVRPVVVPADLGGGLG